MTQERFDELPGRLRACHMREVLALSDKGLETWRELHAECILETTGKKRNRRYVFSKQKVAPHAGFVFR